MVFPRTAVRQLLMVDYPGYQNIVDSFLSEYYTKKFIILNNFNFT